MFMALRATTDDENGWGRHFHLRAAGSHSSRDAAKAANRTTSHGSSHHPGWHLLGDPDRCLLAGGPRALWSLADAQHAVSALAASGYVATDPRCPRSGLRRERTCRP